LFGLNQNDSIAYWRHKARKCAEVLVAQRVDPQFLTGAHVLNNEAAVRLGSFGFTLAVKVSPELFFR
jgi:hypothetical protein